MVGPNLVRLQGLLRARPSERLPPLPTAAALLATSLLVAFNLLTWAQTQIPPRDNDFTGFWVRGRVVSEHGIRAVYGDEFHRMMVAVSGNPDEHMLEVYPPPIDWLVAEPISQLPYVPAWIIWTLIMVAALVAGWRLVVTGSPWERAAHLTMLFGLFPVIFGLIAGAAVYLLFPLLAVVWWLITKGRETLAGILLGLALIKPQTACLVPVALLAAGHWRAFRSWLVVASVILVASVVAMGRDAIAVYLATLDQASRIEFLHRFALVSHLPFPFSLTAQLVVLGLTLVAARRLRAAGPGPVIAIGLLGSLMFTPYLNMQDLTMAVLAAWLILSQRREPWLIALMIVSYLALELINVLGPWPWLALEVVWLGLACFARTRIQHRPPPPSLRPADAT